MDCCESLRLQHPRFAIEELHSSTIVADFIFLKILQVYHRENTVLKIRKKKKINNFNETRAPLHHRPVHGAHVGGQIVFLRKPPETNGAHELPFHAAFVHQVTSQNFLPVRALVAATAVFRTFGRIVFRELVQIGKPVS